MKNKKTFYVISGAVTRRYLPDEYELLPDNYISLQGNESFPIEDVSYIFDEKNNLTSDEVFEKWFKYLDDERIKNQL